MGFFRTLKRLFQGYDITEGGDVIPMNRKERRAHSRKMQKRDTKARLESQKPVIQKYSVRKQKWNQRQKNRKIGG